MEDRMKGTGPAHEGDRLIAADATPWLPMNASTRFRLLRCSRETGQTTLMLKIAAGTRAPAHTHFGASEYLVLSGTMELDGGELAGGVTARAGDYGYEATGAVHGETFFPEETVLYFTRYGPSATIGENQQILSVLDWKRLSELQAEGLAQLGGT